MPEQTQNDVNVLATGSSNPALGVAKKAFTFDTLYTPKVITLVYWFLCLASVVSGLGIMNTGYRGMGVEMFFMGLLAIAGGIVASRIFCELVIVLFKINESLKVMSSQSEREK